jgi:hypothetical protein
MARDPIKGLEERMKRYENVEQIWVQRGMARAFMESIAEQIKKRTRLGKGVNDSGDLEKLGGLAESTIANRKRYRKNLSDMTTYRRSNLTATGQLLDNIKHAYRQGVMLFTFGGTRTKELSGPGKGTRNAEVAAHVSKARPFFRLSRTEAERFSRRLRAEFLKIIRGP